MRFERKIFIAVFCSSLLIGLALIWAAHRYASAKARDEFLSRYSVFSRVLADTLSRLDTSTEALMLNAAHVVAARDGTKGLLSTEELRDLRSTLGVTHIFMVEKDGTFVRSTNEDPHLIPNFYSFCPQYRGIWKGTLTQRATPIISPRPEPKPFKFLFVPNEKNNRIIEIGVRVDSIAKTLTEAVKADRNIRSMRLYSPDGTSFGKFAADSVAFDGEKTVLPDSLPSVKEDGDTIHFYTRATSSHPQCCQCDISGTSKNGDYYYVLESSVSKDELTAVQARMGQMFGLFAVVNVLLSLAVAKLLSCRLVKNIRSAVKRVRSIKESGDLSARIALEGQDEVAFLTKEFDRLLSTLDESQRRLVEAEKAESKVKLARVVAHNIRSPIVAIEMMIPQLISIPERTRKVLVNSVKEIKGLAEKLRDRPEDAVAKMEAPGQANELVFLPAVIGDIVSQKQVEFSNRQDVRIEFQGDQSLPPDCFVKVNSAELRTIISNLVNNAIESYAAQKGSAEVDVKLSSAEKFFSVEIRDFGSGIPNEYLSDLGRRQITFKGEKGRGVGLTHAMTTIETWGGRLRISSTVGQGTSVTIDLPRYRPRTELETGQQAIGDGFGL